MKKQAFFRFWLIVCIIALTISFASCDETVAPTETTANITETAEITYATETTIVPETTSAPETNAVSETTKVPETTILPETTSTPETTTAPETTSAPDTTSAPETTEPPHVHAWSSWTTTLNATCTANGKQERNCKCGEKETKQISALGHTEVIDKAVASTCIVSGKTEGKHCSVCNIVLIEQTALNLVAHTYNNDKDENCNICGFVRDVSCKHARTVTLSAKVPTCTGAGLTEGKKCSDCGEILVKQDTINALGHTEVIDKAVAATCTKNGKSEGKHCSVCKVVLVAQEVVKATGHVYGEWTVTTPATCTIKGREERVCTCGKKEWQTIAELGHTASNWITDRVPTCSRIGSAHTECTVCGKKMETQTLDLLPHTEVIDAAVEATCTAYGKTEGKHCSVCKLVIVKQNTISKTDHNYGEWKVTTAATCTIKGREERVCTCGKKEYQSIDALGHSYGEWTVTKNATCTVNGRQERVCNNCSRKEKQTVAMLGHTEVIDSAITATCTNFGKTEGKHCSVCNFVTVEQKIVEALGHTEVIDKEVEPTLTSTGLAKGSHCSVCGIVIIRQRIIPKLQEFDDPNIYNDDYGYLYLGTMSKGDNLQKFYKMIDQVAFNFHTNSSINANNNVVGEFNFASLGLTDQEALAVWNIYKNDHPLYYWISATVRLSGTQLYLLTEKEYSRGSEREKYNKFIYDSAKEYVNGLHTETTEYRIALALHDAIIYAIDYAYETDGRTPKDEPWAHNILGVFEKQGGVCESYAKTFQMLLNCMGVENIFVTGIANGENHAWNLVKMDDENWYWFDLTWDDISDFMWGVQYNYFCVYDTQNIYKGDYVDDTTSEAFFTDTHEIYLPTNDGLEFLYDLPAVSNTEYKSAEPILCDTFSINGLEYAIVGYNKVALFKIDIGGVVSIPEKVQYKTETYEIIAIGSIKNSSFNLSCIKDIADETTMTEITIPKTVRFIWDWALWYPFLENIHVKIDNPYFASFDGVLFSKNKYTLIQYPLANKRTEYTIPDEVFQIGETAFTANGELLYLEKLTIGANVDLIGTPNWGWGYTKQSPNVISSTFGNIYMSLTGSREITVDTNNSMFKIYDHALYSSHYGEDVLLCVLDKDITSMTILDTTIRINDKAFEDCTLLTNIILPDNINYIGSSAFYNCISLKNITIPAGVTQIWFNTFDGCTSLISVDIPKGISWIGVFAFQNCTSLTSIYIPDSVTKIEGKAFKGCTSLTDVYFAGTETEWNAIATGTIKEDLLNAKIHFNS